MVLRERGAQQLAAFALIGRAGHAHVGNAAHKRDVVCTRMGGAVGPHQAGPVQCKHHGQVLQGHVVDHLVVAALQKGGIDRHHGLHALAGHASGKGDGMLLGDAHVVITVGETLVELDHA